MLKQLFGRVGVALAVAVVATGGALAQTLGVGDPAPPIVVKEFVKGQPVKKFEKGKPYVVEFWATWCGPCKTSIPHLTELQKKHKDVTFIGVSVFEQDQKGVKPFVTQMGDKMAYRVAVDAVPAGGAGTDGTMAKTWMIAAGQEGIPTAFIVDRAGKVAWIGHPMAMDEPLAKVAAGKWDMTAEKARQEKAQAMQAKMDALRTKLMAAQQSGDPQKLLAVVEDAIADDPSLELGLAQVKWGILTGPRGDRAKALAYGNHIITDVYKSEPMGLNNFAWSIVDPARPEKADSDLVALALKAALRADELLKGKDSAVADTLAKAYFDSGDVAKALETQERAIKLAKGTPQESDKEMMARLEQYRAAKK